jgi:hypothetical protein
MKFPACSSALICPYPLMEEEALAWTALLFNQVYGLMPFPLEIPETFRKLGDLGLLQMRVFPRTGDEIREKDRFLRELHYYVAGLPELGFLEYLNQTGFKKEFESLDEILRSLREGFTSEAAQEPSVLTGSFLLCLIHDWLVQEWAIDQALAGVEQMETALTQGWREDFGEETSAALPRPQKPPRALKEIPCPLALGAWRILRHSLFPEPWTLITTQSWVWADYYGVDPREARVESVLLPELGSDWIQKVEEWESQGKGKAFKESFAGLLAVENENDWEGKMSEFRESLRALGLSQQGRYRLIFPSTETRENILSRSDRQAELMLLMVLENG